MGKRVNDASNQRDEIDGIAAAWTARLGDTALSEAERRELDDWLAESPSHIAAFSEAQAAWRKMDALRHAPGALANDAPSHRPGARVSRARADRNQRASRWPRAAALAACLLLAIGGTSFWYGNPILALTADYRTEPGERRTVALPDGSRVELGPDSAVAVAYGAGRRRVDLLSGQAYFIAAPMNGDETRPFIVEAAGGMARALGTRFMVDRLSAVAVEVTVAEHDVQVTPPGGNGDTAGAILSPGQSVRYGEAGLGPIRNRNPDQAAAWLRNRIVFDHRALGDVVTELNRYRRGRIVIADPTLAARKVSGVFETDDPDAVLATIIRNLRIHTVSLPPFVTLLY